MVHRWSANWLGTSNNWRLQSFKHFQSTFITAWPKNWMVGMIHAHHLWVGRVFKHVVSTSMYLVTASECLHIKKRLWSSKPNMTRLGLWQPNNDEFAWKIQAIAGNKQMMWHDWCPSKKEPSSRMGRGTSSTCRPRIRWITIGCQSEVEICTCEITIVSLM
jgi:hypothetical protein